MDIKDVERTATSKRESGTRNPTRHDREESRSDRDTGKESGRKDKRHPTRARGSRRGRRVRAIIMHARRLRGGGRGRGRARSGGRGGVRREAAGRENHVLRQKRPESCIISISPVDLLQTDDVVVFGKPNNMTHFTVIDPPSSVVSELLRIEKTVTIP